MRVAVCEPDGSFALLDEPFVCHSGRKGKRMHLVFSVGAIQVVVNSFGWSRRNGSHANLVTDGKAARACRVKGQS